MKVLLVWVLAMFLCVCGQSFSTPVGDAHRLERDIEDGRLAERAETALSNLLYVAAGELKKANHALTGSTMIDEWEGTYRGIFRSYAMGMSSRDIGDHAPLSKWLADKYDLLEFFLGVDVCKATHLSDIKTFNFCIPIVFRPCSFPMDSVTGERSEEYKRHFAEGAVYYGLIPVISYWVTYGGCLFASSGTGFVMVCGIAGSVVEKICANFVAPRLSDWVYEKACE